MRRLAAAILRYFSSNIDEVAADPALRVYGALLAALHVLTFIHWRTDVPLAKILERGKPVICWPFFEACGDYRTFSGSEIDVVLWIYLGVAVLAIALYAHRRLALPAWLVLLALNLFKALIWAQDYRLRLNQHLMAFFITAVFLFLPSKRRLLAYQIVFFYFWAGVLKLHPEWLSGKTLYARPLGVPEALVPAACVYVLVLEMVLVFGLLARRRWIFWTVLVQLLLFHLTSFTVVGFYYPTLMAAILAIFPLARFLGPVDDRASLRRLFSRHEPASTRGWLAFFTALQLLHWVFPGDTAVTGEGRLFSLHMFDAKVICEAEIVVHERGGQTSTVPIDLGMRQTRIACDPLVYLGAARELCGRYRRTMVDFEDLDLVLRARRSNEASLRPLIDQKAFCASHVEYDVWWPNAWILKD